MRYASFMLLAFGLGSALDARATTVLSGHIVHPVSDKVVVYETGRITGGPRGPVEGKVDARGNFRLEIPALMAPTPVTFGYGDETTSCYLTPGDNLSISLDPNKFDESIHYAGTGAAANNYLAQSYLKFENDEASPLAKAAASAPAQLQALADGYRQQRLAFLAAYARAHPLTPAFRAYARQAIAFDWATSLLVYPLIRKKAAPQHVQALPVGYDDFLAVIRPIQDSALLARNEQYLNFMKEYVHCRLIVPGQPLTGNALLAATRQQFGDGPSRDLAAAKYIYQVLSEQGGAAAAPLRSAFQLANRDSALARSIREMYRKQPEIDRQQAKMAAQEAKEREVLGAGKEAPGFTVYDASGLPVRLADYRGKVVYLDFWASWCGPCMAEVPASAALKKKFEGQDVVFLYVSIDDKEENWKKVLATKPLQSPNSVHTLDKGWAAPAPTAYVVRRIPAYFLIGRDGRFAVAEAPRPSDGERTAALLNEALTKK